MNKQGAGKGVAWVKSNCTDIYQSYSQTTKGIA